MIYLNAHKVQWTSKESSYSVKYILSDKKIEKEPSYGAGDIYWAKNETICEFSSIDEAIKYLKRFLKVKKDELEKIINNYHSNA